MISKLKRRSQRLNKRKETLLKKVYEIREFYEVDVALILRIRKTGRYITFKSVDLESFLPSIEQIVSPSWFLRRPGTERALITYLLNSNKPASI
jgi:hypothetical protein